ncbi:MAG: putative glycosyltransferase [Myxococcaceae bacterium]|nr:putative glycosyltransferase [Myxococcaceae bacterium]
MSSALTSIELCGMPLASVDSSQLLDHLFESLAQGKGGWLVTANLDILRRHVKDPEARGIYAEADVRVADGMPLVWASRLRGTPLPERVAGSSLVGPLCARSAREGRRVYLLGGDPKASKLAAQKLLAQHPGLQLAGVSSPWVSALPTQTELDDMARELSAAKPDIVLVAFGSPKQERVIQKLQHRVPGAWWIGVGISLSFIAGLVHRAPPLLQALGLEWVHRLVQEPRRLFKRYVVEDLPFAVELFGRAALDRVNGSARADKAVASPK